MNNKEIWVYIETRDGEIMKSSLELFTPAREIAETVVGSVTAVILGSGITAAANTLGQYGAEKVIAVKPGNMLLIPIPTQWLPW